MQGDTINVPDALMERDCFSMHTGVWCIEPQSAMQLYHTIASDDLEDLIDKAQIGDRPDLIDQVFQDGATAVVPISGSLTKGKSSLGGTSTVEVRQVLDSLAQDGSVENIVLQIDSPGGHVAGVPDLANDVERLANSSDQPDVTAVIQDMGASAAYWIASQANEVVASNEVTKVGSIGVRTVVHDVSERFEERGVKVISMATGPRKDDFVRGQEIEEEAIEHHKAQIEAINKVFVQTVANGREMSFEAVDKLATGETFLAPEARDEGLIDRIASLRQVLAELRGAEEVRTAEGGPVPASAGSAVPSAATYDAARPFDAPHVPEADVEPVEPVDAPADEPVDDAQPTSEPSNNERTATQTETRESMPEPDDDAQNTNDDPNSDLRSLIREEVGGVVEEEVQSALGDLDLEDAISSELQEARTQTRVENKVEELASEYANVDGIEEKLTRIVSNAESAEAALQLLNDQEEILQAQSSNDLSRLFGDDADEIGEVFEDEQADVPEEIEFLVDAEEEKQENIEMLSSMGTPAGGEA